MTYARISAVICSGVMFLLLIIVGCETTLTGYNFKISAIYKAPVSNFTMIIDSKGYVKSGRDVSDEYEGIILISPSSKKDPGKNIKLHLTSQAEDILYLIESDRKHTVAWGMREDYKSFKNILESAGYKYLSEEEIRETIKAISGALSGPKGVILEGQSKYINVIKVNY